MDRAWRLYARRGIVRILVVDDEAQIRRFLRLGLNAYGYQVIEAAHGEAGLARCATERPDLVILDLGLPDLDGQAVITHIREWSSVPIIVLSVRAAEIMDNFEAIGRETARRREHAPDLGRALHLSAPAEALQPADGPLRARRRHLEHLLEWSIRHAFLVVPTQALAAQFLATFKDHPPRQKPSSFNLDEVVEKLQKPAGG